MPNVVAEPLNDVQLMLLRLFSRPMPAYDVEAIRELLLNYYEAALHKEVERVIEEKKLRELILMLFYTNNNANTHKNLT